MSLDLEPTQIMSEKDSATMLAEALEGLLHVLEKEGVIDDCDKEGIPYFEIIRARFVLQGLRGFMKTANLKG